MKRQSIYFLNAITVLALVLAFDLYFQRKRTIDFYREDYVRRLNNLDVEAELAQKVNETLVSPEDTPKYLDHLRSLQHIDYWIILNGESVEQSSITEVSSEILKKVKDYNAAKLGALDEMRGGGIPNRSFTVQSFSDGRRLVLGLNYDEERYLQTELKLIWDGIVTFLFGIMTISICTFAFFFRDIMQSIRKLREQGKPGLRARKRSFLNHFTLSKEADFLARGLEAYDSQNLTLREQKERYRWQLLSSLRSELDSGNEPPYDFTCTLVRTDINNFTKIYNNHSVAEFMETINDFFSDVTHIVSHYGGYVHEFVGDEVLFYFKESEVGNSVAIALAAVEDINRVAERIHVKTLRERNYPFTIKSALAHDRLRFGRLANGFGFSGPSLIETVRIVSTVAEKDGNVVVLDERHLELVREFISTEGPMPPLFRLEFHSTVTLKGFSGQRRIFVSGGRITVEEYLHWGSAISRERLAYFRGDIDVQKIIAWLKRDWQTAPVREVMQVIGVLRHLTLTRESHGVFAVVYEWLGELLLVNHDSSRVEDACLILASALRLLENFATDFVDDRTRASLIELLEPVTCHFDRRVAANAIEVLASMRLEVDAKLEILMCHIDNRVAANAIIWAGKREINAFVLKELGKILRSENLGRVASGIYALGEIASYHQKQDPVYYGTQVEILSLVESLLHWAGHSNESIRRQAVSALEKLNGSVVVDSAATIVQADDQRDASHANSHANSA
jgi:class 3 adenylate cyclase